MPTQREQFIALAAKFEPRLRAALIRAFNVARIAVSERRLVEALQSGGIEAVMQTIGNFSNVLDSEIGDILDEAILAGGQNAYLTVPNAAFIADAVRYDQYNSATVDFVRNYKLNLINSITNTTREAVRNSLQTDIVAGVNPIETARKFKNNLGLTPKQEKAVRNYQTYLENLETTALKRELRDKRFDRTIENAISSNTPLKQSQIDRMVNRYRERFIQYRSRVIARTESLRALSIGNQAAVRQMIAENEIDPNNVKKFWVFRRDSRTREAHRAVPGLNPEGRLLNEPFVTPLGPLQFPRDPNGRASNTVQCRCTVRYEIVEPPQTEEI